MKANIRHGDRLRPDIEHVHLTEYGEVANEAIEPRTNINVALRSIC